MKTAISRIKRRFQSGDHCDLFFYDAEEKEMKVADDF